VLYGDIVLLVTLILTVFVVIVIVGRTVSEQRPLTEGRSRSLDRSEPF
jgi:hypothetical protein